MRTRAPAADTAGVLASGPMVTGTADTTHRLAQHLKSVV